MTKSILAVSTRPCNPVKALASLISAAFEEYAATSGESYPLYYQELRTLVGLCVTAILAEGSDLQSYGLHFATFMRYRDFLRHRDQFEVLALAIAELLRLAMRASKTLGFPRYHEDLLLALTNVHNPSNTQTMEQKKAIERMIKCVFALCQE